MATVQQRCVLAGMIFVAALSMGCSLLSVPVFLLSGMNPKHDPQCKLASKDKDKEVKVLILCSSGLETRPEFVHADREIASLLSRELQNGFKENKEKVTVVSTSKVEKYKDEHPNWRSMDPEEFGKSFNADYVIDLTIESLTLYEPGSGATLFRGRTEIGITVVDVNKPGDDPIYREQYTTEYPRTAGIQTMEGSAEKFRLAFLKNVAKQLSWRFTAHTTQDDFSKD